MRAVGGLWVIREHWVEYFLPAYVGEEIEIKTWWKTSGALDHYAS
jgi:acyl-CoA thioesterase FadM